MAILTFALLRESHGPTLLRWKAKRSGMKNPSAGSKGSAADAKAILIRSISRPMRILIRSPIVTGLSLYLATVYGYLYLLFTTFSTVFPDQYGFDTGILGLSFIGMGIGITVGLLGLSWFSDRIQVKQTKKHGFSKPE